MTRTDRADLGGGDQLLAVDGWMLVAIGTAGVGGGAPSWRTLNTTQFGTGARGSAVIPVVPSRA